MAPMRRKGNYMRNKSWLRFVALLSVLALVLAACGDGDEATDETDETRAAAFEAGMNEYLMKPARVEGIKQLLIKLFSTKI